MSAQNDAAFLRVFLIILGALVAFTATIMVVASFITGDIDDKRQQDSRLQAAIAERIKPVGEVSIAKAGAVPAAPKSGDQVVAESCNSCHATGVLNAPKIGDKADWEARLSAVGMDGLIGNAINGKGAMPPRGGAATLSDDEIRAAVEHMLEKSDIAGTSAAAAPAVATEAEPVAVTATPAQPADADAGKGKAVYDSACLTCHMSGVANAPKLGDKAAWTDRIASGMDALYANAINGKGAMPPKGGRADIADEDIKAAVDYLVSESK